MLARTVQAAVVVALTASSTAMAHMPRTDGGPADRGCAPVLNASIYVGVSGGGSCSIARTVARGSVQGQRFERWRCTGRRSNFGHCHGRGIRRGQTVHWAAND